MKGIVRRARTLLLLALLAPLAGCAEDDWAQGHRLAEPTEAPAFPPSPTPPSPQPVDLRDPGYEMASTWRVGDGWDYVSNSTPGQHFRNLRVVEERVQDGRRLVRVDESYGTLGNRASSRSSYWVDTTNFTRLNTTDMLGGLSVHEPPAPLRYFRNGSYAYNTTDYTSDGRVAGQSRVVANSVYRGEEPVPMTWGNILAGKVEHRIVAVTAAGNERTLVTYWVWDEAAAPVAIDYDGEERFRLVAFKAGENARSVLA